jgi:N-acetylneuraminic acid mutarotase
MRLPDGRVLVAGGADNPTGTATASAELFDPTTGTWTPTGDMNAVRVLYTATLLPDGRVVVAGGLDALAIANGVPIASTEIFDPETGMWTRIGDLKTSHALHTATLLPDARVLVAGSGGSPLDPLLPQTAHVELLDPLMANWTATGDLHTRRKGHTATLLPDGLVLVAGGQGAAARSAETFDPATEKWTAIGNLTVPRDGHTATLLPNDLVLVAGGKDGAARSSTELYDPATGSWTPTGNLTTRREGHTATLLPNGRVLVAGGKGEDARSSAELFDPATDSWTPTGNLTTRREGHTATLLPNGRVLVAGGKGKDVPRSAELFDPATGSWTATGNLTTRRDEGHTATLLPNGRVLVAGGKGKDARRSAELFDPATGSWTATGNLTTRRDKGHTATLLPNGRVLVAGGKDADDDDGAAGRSAEVFDPTTGKWTATGNLNTARSGHTVTLVPDGRVVVAGGKGGDDDDDDDGGAATSSAELFDRGGGFINAWRPVLTEASSPLLLGGPLLVTGEQFRGVSEASGGNAVQNASTDYPLVQLRRLDNEQMRFLPADTWSDTSFISLPVTDFPAGHAVVTVFSNSIPSISKIIRIAQP